MSAADLANDQDRELTVVTAERDDLQLRLDEAEAVIDAVRKVRDEIKGDGEEAEHDYIDTGNLYDAGLVDGFTKAVDLLDKVDGL
jgi:hypothetical protein